MKGLMVFLRVAVVGFALLAGGSALYRNRDKLRDSWKSLGGVEGLRGLTSRLPMGRLLDSAGSLRSLAGQLSRRA